jgi:hypothetical protein
LQALGTRHVQNFILVVNKPRERAIIWQGCHNKIIIVIIASNTWEKANVQHVDVVPPMYDSAYYAISGYVVADTTKTKFLFLFLPRKEKIRNTIGVQYWWSMLSLKESG